MVCPSCSVSCQETNLNLFSMHAKCTYAPHFVLESFRFGSKMHNITMDYKGNLLEHYKMCVQVELGELAPILAEKSEITNKLLNQVANDQSAAQKV